MLPSCVAAKARYVSAVLSALQSRLPGGAALMSTVAAVSIENELAWSTDALPWSVRNGTVRGSDGNAYDLSSADSR